MRKAGIWKDMILAHREPRSRKGRNVREPAGLLSDSEDPGDKSTWQFEKATPSHGLSV